MIVQLTHPFLWRCKNWQPLLNNCIKFNTFCSRLEKQAVTLFPIEGAETEEERKCKLDRINKYKGEGFEIFVEAMIRLFPCDKRLGLIEGYNNDIRQDVGVDGFGICGYNQKPMTVQCKYRQHDWELTANQDHLTNFTSASMLHYGVDQVTDPITGKCNMLIISSADSLSFFTDHEMFGEKVYAFCRKEIRALVDNNPTFWKYFAQSWAASLELVKKDNINENKSYTKTTSV